MELNEKHIELFDQYINGTLSKKWRQAVDEKRQNEPEFEQAFQEHLKWVKSIQMAGRKELKAELAAIHQGMSPDDTSYKGPKKGGSGLLKGLIFVAIIGALGYIGYTQREWIENLFKEWITIEEVYEVREVIVPVEPDEVDDEQTPIIEQTDEDVTEEVIVDTVHTTIVLDPNDQESVKAYEEYVRQLQEQGDEVILEFEEAPQE